MHMIGKLGVKGQVRQAHLCCELDIMLTTCLVSWFQLLSNLTPQLLEGCRILLKVNTLLKVKHPQKHE